MILPLLGIVGLTAIMVVFGALVIEWMLNQKP